MDGYAVIQELVASWSAKHSSDKQMPLSSGDKLGPYEILALHWQGRHERSVARDLRTSAIA
jgi:hypothetical protein